MCTKFSIDYYRYSCSMVCTQLYSSMYTAVQLFVTVSSLGTMVVWLLKIKKEHKGAWIISARSIRVPYPPIKQGGNRTRVETAQDHQTWTTQQENFKKSWASMENQEFWSPGSTFQCCFYGGNYIRIFWGSSIDLARPDGEVTFTRLPKASTRYYVLFRLLRASAAQKV